MSDKDTADLKSNKLFKLIKEDVIRTSFLVGSVCSYTKNPTSLDDQKKIINFLLESINDHQSIIKFMDHQNLKNLALNTQYDHEVVFHFLMDRINCVLLECPDFRDELINLCELIEYLCDFLHFRTKKMTTDHIGIALILRDNPWLIYLYFVKLFKFEIANNRLKSLRSYQGTPSIINQSCDVDI